MNRFLKLLIILPVALIAFSHYDGHYSVLLRSADRKLYSIEYFINVFPLFILILADWGKRQTKTIWMALTQSSFYVYLYAVLSLTIYFIPLAAIYNDVMGNGLSVNTYFGFNMQPFEKFNIYEVTDRQVVGNLIMLLPLGIYLPILYKPFRKAWVTMLTACLFSCSIELTQLLFSIIGPYGRSFDVDDIILNSLGGIIGYMMYRIGEVTFRSIVRRRSF